MTVIIPVIGGQYRFKITEGEPLIGVFTHYSIHDNSFDIDVYVEAFTPVAQVPPMFGSLCGLPDLKRRDEHPQIRISIDNIIILDRLYICKNSVLQDRKVQWRLGMRNMYRIADNEADDHLSFIGFDRVNGRYINEEHCYHTFKMYIVELFNETLRSTKSSSEESFLVPNVNQNDFDRFVREIDNWELYYKAHCTKKDDSWAVPVMLNNGVRLDKIPRDEESIQIPFVRMLQPILGNNYWYFIWNLPKYKSTVRDPAGCEICALPVRNCNLVFRLDTNSRKLRVQFRIQRGSYDDLVNELHRGDNEIRMKRQEFLGRWIRDDIKDTATWLLIVAVEINTENVASIQKRYSSKKQEVFGAKAVVFALSQAVLYNALPHGVEVAAEPNTFGALLQPIIYRDVGISCMYLLEDVLGMLVPTLEVPTFEAPIMQERELVVSQAFLTPKKKEGRQIYKSERKSDLSSGAYVSTIKKVRQTEDYPKAKDWVHQILGSEWEEDTFHHSETVYILHCLDTECSSQSLYSGLVHYKHTLINAILRDDFNYSGDEVSRNKENLLIICKAFLNTFSI